MTNGPAAQRKVLRDYKYPDPEGLAQAKYYREARSAIAKFHRDGPGAGWLDLQSAGLMAGAESAAKAQVATRLENNARAVAAYGQNFGTVQYELLADVPLTLIFGNVQVAVNPDLHVREGGKEKLLKLDFSGREPEAGVVKVVAQGMFEAALAGGLTLSSSQVLYVDVARGVRHKGARAGARMRANIEAACQNIEAVWPTV